MNEILLKHNKQWVDNSIRTGIERDILPKILSSLKVKHIVAISGGRRTGKSYLFRQIISHLIESEKVNPENILQINFEDPFFISLKNDEHVLGKLFKEYKVLKNPKGKVYVFLDEIQNMLNWQYWLRDIYDRLEDQVKIFITGSNSELLSSELNTHLTGRVLAYENFPFSLKEYFRAMVDTFHVDTFGLKDCKNVYGELFEIKEELIHYVEKAFDTGLYPELFHIEERELQKDILNQYMENVIFKDIVPRFSIRNSKTIEQLAYYLSTNFTSLFSYRKLAAAVGSNENTIKEYLSYLEKAYLFFPVEYFDYSLKKQLKRNRKIYCIDNGLRNSTAWKFSKDIGKYAENAVFMSLRRKYKDIHYWQEDGSNHEIDFVVLIDNKPIAINVTYTDDIEDREFNGFVSFSKFSKESQNILITRNRFETVEKDGVKIELIPLWLFVMIDF